MVALNQPSLTQRQRQPLNSSQSSKVKALEARRTSHMQPHFVLTCTECATLSVDAVSRVAVTGVSCGCVWVARVACVRRRA